MVVATAAFGRSWDWRRCSFSSWIPHCFDRASAGKGKRHCCWRFSGSSRKFVCKGSTQHRSPVDSDPAQISFAYSICRPYSTFRDPLLQSGELSFVDVSINIDLPNLSRIGHGLPLRRSRFSSRNRHFASAELEEKSVLTAAGRKSMGNSPRGAVARSTWSTPKNETFLGANDFLWLMNSLVPRSVFQARPPFEKIKRCRLPSPPRGWRGEPNFDLFTAPDSGVLLHVRRFFFKMY